MSNPNIYFFIGEDQAFNLNKIKILKEKILPNGTADFNIETLFAKGLSPVIMEEALARMPVEVKKRVLIIRNMHQLSDECCQKLLLCLEGLSPEIVLILEAALETKQMNGFFKYAQVFKLAEKKDYNTFDLCRAIEARKQVFSLTILEDLLLRGENPSKILGGLVWKWENMQKSVAKEKLDKGFEALLEADTNIKLSRIKPEIALELLVTKLTLLA